jgi:diguanylate cyclase (GGDEF)-like protein
LGARRSPVWRRVARFTAASVALSVVISYALLRLALPPDTHGAVSAASVLRFTLFVSALVPAIVCPLVAWRHAAMNHALATAHASLRRVALADQLTGALNRRGFEEEAAAALLQAAATRAPVAALMCDIDAFKQVNDQFGHDFGDAAILHLARLLQAHAAPGGGLVGRQGGDEFAVLLPGATQRDALVLAEACRRACAATGVTHGHAQGVITVSIGVAARGRADMLLSPLLREADQALYRAKRAGRDRVVAFDGSVAPPRATG